MRPLSYRVLATGAVLLAGCAREPAAARTEAVRALLPVRVAAVRSVTAPAPIEIPGTVRPVERAVIAAKIFAVIESLPLTLGQSVKRGDPLARLVAPELAARLAQARAQLDQATRDERRTRELAAAGADAPETALTAAERLRVARAAVAEAEALLAYTDLRAPYDGRITQKLADPGDLASPGQPLLVLERSSALQIEAFVPASLAVSLALGTAVPAHVADVAEPFLCHVAEIAAAADPATRTVHVKFALPATTAAISGRAARLELPGAAAEMLLVPSAAVTRFGQMERVFVVADRRAQLRLVRTGATRNDCTELLAGVSAGEIVVVAPPGTLRDGQPLTLAP